MDTITLTPDEEIFGVELSTAKQKALQTLDSFVECSYKVEIHKEELKERINNAKTQGEINRVMRQMRDYI